jgi:hypothetical protein
MSEGIVRERAGGAAARAEEAEVRSWYVEFFIQEVFI